MYNLYAIITEVKYRLRHSFRTAISVLKMLIDSKKFIRRKLMDYQDLPPEELHHLHIWNFKLTN